MAVTFAVGLRACCVAVGLLLAAARAADSVSPLVGATRDQVLSRYGEPRSQMEVGNRVIFLYPRERIVLRDGVVVEVEQLAADPTASGTPATPPAASSGEATGPGVRPGQSSAADAKLEIKLVRPPSARDSRPSIPEPAKPTDVSKDPLPTRVVPTIVPEETSTPVQRPSLPVKQAEHTASTDTPEAILPDTGKKKADEKAVVDAQKEQTAKTARRPPEAAPAPAPEPAGDIFSGRTYLLALVIVAGGAGVLYWRHRQRQLELTASSVENTPLAAVTAPVFTGNGFTADQINKLDWKRFEELVAAYYSKTGVVAVRTKTGPDSAVHIKISWKGEPRPFAYVQCISRPAGLIDPKPLQALIAALSADDIRRGYVVSTGKFNVPARDLAGEKHLTLLPGDIFLEKLNALPTSARAEIMQSIGEGDPVPSCPKCDAKMVQSADNPPVWRCPNHPDQIVPVRK